MNGLGLEALPWRSLWIGDGKRMIRRRPRQVNKVNEIGVSLMKTEPRASEAFEIAVTSQTDPERLFEIMSGSDNPAARQRSLKEGSID
jgi:hypothetical protein